jgi:crossover junction endodeoxyribonuclease RuvC
MDCNLNKKIILGIDPGSRITGFGLIEMKGSQYQFAEAGCIKVGDGEIGPRLFKIHEKLCEIIEQHQPDEIVIEQIFTNINHQSALKLGQARGVALLTAAKYTIPIFEYTARHVKKSVVGYGAANKDQVQHMVRAILKLTYTPQADAADALAIAICHAHTKPLRQKVASATLLT